MENKTKDIKQRTITIYELLGLLFIYLKLTSQIDWSWLWITCPFWGIYAFWLAIAGLAFFGGILLSIINSLWNFTLKWFLPKNKKED
jgi:hypothetical protein